MVGVEISIRIDVPGFGCSVDRNNAALRFEFDSDLSLVCIRQVCG